MTSMELELIKLIAQVGLDAAITIITSIKGVNTIDDAIAALQVAKSKTAQQYLDEAKAALPPPVTPPVTPPPTP